MFEKKDIIKIIFLGIAVLLLIIITVIFTKSEESQLDNKNSNISNKNEIVNNTIKNNTLSEEQTEVKYVEYKVNYNLTNEERKQMQEQADKREMEGGFDDKNFTR